MKQEVAHMYRYDLVDKILRAKVKRTAQFEQPILLLSEIVVVVVVEVVVVVVVVVKYYYYNLVCLKYLLCLLISL